MWCHGYPNIDDFNDDLKRGNLYMILDGEIAIATLGVYLDPIDYFFFRSKDGNKYQKMLEILKINNNGKSLVLERLMVDPSRRGEGLAKFIMDEIGNLYPDYNLLGAVFHENDHLKPFYEKLGYTIVDPYNDWEWKHPEYFYLIGKAKH